MMTGVPHDMKQKLLGFGFSERDISRLKPAEAQWLIENGPEEGDEFVGFDNSETGHDVED
jgi:hypothetical protein